MPKLDKIVLRNFKAFYDEIPINLKGKHLLLYGENGSGKSSIYWSLYTVLQSVLKEVPEVQKYFQPNNPENLINLNFLQEAREIDDVTDEVTYPNTIGRNSYVELIFDDSKKIKIDSAGLDSGGNVEFLEELNERSDFITHRLLVNFFNFSNSGEINLWEVFKRDVFPFLKTDFGNGETTLADRLKKIENSLPFSLKGSTFQITKSAKKKERFNERINSLNADISYWINDINTRVTEFYNDHFQYPGEEDIEISLEYTKELSFSIDHEQEYQSRKRIYRKPDLNDPEISLKLRVMKDGRYVKIRKPQSFFNEARLTRIALAIRFTLLLDAVRPDFAGKILALDDLLVSLDMSNRERVLDIILKEFAPEYQILFFTHSFDFYRFVKYKIRQKNSLGDWNLQEIYFDEEDKKPKLVDSQLDNLERAKHYYKAKDFIASAVYLRKEIEHFVKERLPEEFQYVPDEKYHTLDHLWKLFIDRYKGLGFVIENDVQNAFKQSKLIVLNPSAHDNLSQRIYKTELDSAFELVDKLKKDFPLFERTLILKAGRRLEFKHPKEEYAFVFSLTSDLCIDHIKDKLEPNDPKCSIISWTYKGQSFYDFKTKRVLKEGNKQKILSKPVKFHKMIDNLAKEAVLKIDKELFISHSFLRDSHLSLKSILEGFTIGL